MLLVNEAHDGTRATWLMNRTTEAGDRLESVLSPGTDAHLDAFRAELEAESDHAD